MWIALGCFALGGALGAGLGALLFQGNPLAWTGVALLLGVVFACLSFKLYLGGIFVLCFMLGWVITLIAMPGCPLTKEEMVNVQKRIADKKDALRHEVIAEHMQ